MSTPALLTRLASFYAAGREAAPRGGELVRELGLNPLDPITSFEIGFAAGNLMETLPRDDALTADLTQLGVLGAYDHQVTTDRLAVQLWDTETGGVTALVTIDRTTRNKDVCRPAPPVSSAGRSPTARGRFSW